MSDTEVYYNSLERKFTAAQERLAKVDRSLISVGAESVQALVDAYRARVAELNNMLRQNDAIRAQLAEISRECFGNDVPDASPQAICSRVRDLSQRPTQERLAEVEKVEDALSRVVGKIGLGQPLLPDTTLPQDVAFLAFHIQKLGERLAAMQADRDAIVNTARMLAQAGLPYFSKQAKQFPSHDTGEVLRSAQLAAKKILPDGGYASHWITEMRERLAHAEQKAKAMRRLAESLQPMLDARIEFNGTSVLVRFNSYREAREFQDALAAQEQK